MPYIGNNPKVTELNVSTKSVDILADVDTVSDAPEIGQVLKWNGTNWVPEDDTGTGGGATSSNLQGVTDNGSSTTNVIDAAGFKLNADQLSTVAGTQGDIKKIGGLPYYHDGTAWKRFYLFDNVEDATTVDVNWDDVQVRLDFEQSTGTSTYPSRNHVNGISPRATTYNPATDNIGLVSSPVKFGTKSLQLLNVSLNSSLYWDTADDWDPIFNDVYQNFDAFKPGTRGGCIDWAGDWTMEFWIYFPTGALTAIQGPYTNGWGMGLFSARETIGGNVSGYAPTFGLILDGNSPKNLKWVNTKTNVAFPLIPNYTFVENTWYHIAVSRDSTDGRISGFINGIYHGGGIDTSIWSHTSLSSKTYFGRYYYGGAYPGGYTPAINLGCNCFIDDLRITQFRRYTQGTNFTAPTAAYPIAAPAPSSIDDDWSDVEFRMTFDTNFNDISPNSYVGTTYYPLDVEITTSAVKYGTGSLSVTNNGTENRGLKVGSDIDTSGSWTIEMWINFNTPPQHSSIIGNTDGILWSNGKFHTNHVNDICAFGIQNIGSNNNLFNFWWYSNETRYTLTGTQIYGTDLINKWNHFALTRDSVSGAINFYFNGYKVSRSNSNGLYDLTPPTITHSSDFEFFIGGRGSWTPTAADFGYNTIGDRLTEGSYTAYFDDVRFTNSVRYTDNFTPPTGPLGTTGTLTTAPIPASSGEGSISLGTTPGWNGTTGWTVQRSQAGIYRVTFPGSFASSQSYVVHATINDGPTSPCHVRVIRYASYFDIVVTQISDGTAVDTGYVAVRLLDLATV